MFQLHRLSIVNIFRELNVTVFVTHNLGETSKGIWAVALSGIIFAVLLAEADSHVRLIS